MQRSSLESASFGPFQLYPAARAIEKNGAPIALGSRALDILIVLVERAGEIVSHKELIARVWRGLLVEPANLRVHMTALRKALGDGQVGVRYIENVTGQGYCFVAPIRRTNAPDAQQAASLSPSPSSRTPTAPMHALPPALARMIGRDDTVRTIAADLRTDRFVTIIGPGGMGKTTVAVSVAHAMLEEFANNVCFVDLGAITDPTLLTATVASTLGLTIQSVEAVVSLMAFLQRTRMLLVLDNCEHIIDAVAALAETVFSQAPEVHILATSREALRVEGEHAHLLRPLGAPPPDTRPDAQTALTFPAVNLFVDRVVMSDRHFALTDTNAQLVSEICARLDGIALALELVAGRIGTYGLEGTADLLKRRLGLHWQGRRTALPRHQTLHSLLEWSYGLLPETEQHVLRRLAIFVGPFTLEAAQAVASDTVGDAAQLTDAVDQLIAKSLVSTVRTPEGRTNFRLLETTRLYGMRKLEESGEEDATAERHARYFVQLSRASSTKNGTTTRYEYLGNLRAALEWCFHDRITTETLRASAVGIDLAAVCAPVFVDLSLWDECRKWSELALARLDDSMRGDQLELVLQQALAISSLLINADDARTAICRGLEIAQRIGATAIRLRLLGALHVYRLRMTDFEGALAVAEEMGAVAKSAGDVSSKVIADWMLGSSHFVLGHPETSKQLFESGFSHGGPDAGRGQQVGGLHYRTRALYGLARVQWLCGYPDRALRTARQAIVEAAATGSPFNISYSLVYCCYIFLWCGDLDAAQEMIDKVMAQPHWQGRLVWFHAEALALKGELLIRRGNVDDGIELLTRVLTDMRASRQKNLMQTVTACCLAEGLTAAGRTEEALAVIDDAITHSPGGTKTWDGPELLRVRAAILLSLPGANAEQAEASVLHALACAGRQGARGWELRTTVTLAQLRATQGRAAEARALLSAAYESFTEGFATRDLTIAAEMLRDLDLTNAHAQIQ